MAKFEDIQNDPSTDRIFIVGGGIVGSALAFYLSKSQLEKQVVVLDKSLTVSLGSTAYAPGFVGQLNASTVLTSLAKDSVNEYKEIPGGFNTVGGLEIATTSSESEALGERQQLAQKAGLPAEIVTPEQAVGFAPDFVKQESTISALHFPTDGTADGASITRFFLKRAEEQGALLVEASVSGVEVEKGTAVRISTTKGMIQTNSNPVIFATGIWTQSLVPDSVTGSPMPIVPVGHPYTFTNPRPPRTGIPYPFVRWPEHKVYARDHGGCDGLGSYRHPSTRVKFPFDSAVGKWPANFETALSDAARICLKNGSEFLTKEGDGQPDTTPPRQPYNGIFAVTPDNLPFAGKAKGTQNIWLCAAVWITHAAGTVKLLVREILRQEGGVTNDYWEEDEEILKALDPDRFKGGDEDALVKQALLRYNDIYNSEPI